ncbi:DUF1634 domain-containing protein [Pseudodesulfovibrio sp. F-1]|uniref:DUF1634 domain-containing protein n=1 Tax=Pseudodesulfovibrio alkaliphilus TaxID=2661613 RepID=A0A7K1KIZ4_9BACT|nr:DUF1634 domain-containing protein [Pseudodesulfovibrio alkaliphilus]MUM76026.1 DUF1634 domain-containing protein [Pseudodesulfovibrio alkaliphilus]
MSQHTDPDIRPMPEQIIYANILGMGAYLGILVMVVTYILYVTGIIGAHIELEMVVRNWHLNVQQFIQVTNAPRGWGWVALLGKGDYLNFLGMALLALLTIVCYLVLLPGFVRRKDWTYFGICVAEVVVLSLAASGIFGSGGH